MQGPLAITQGYTPHKYTNALTLTEWEIEFEIMMTLCRDSA